MSSCIAVASKITEADQEALLSAVDSLIESGVPPASAQRMAANDLLADIEAERTEMEKLVESQHPDLSQKPTVTRRAAQPEKSEVFGKFEDDTISGSRRVATGRIRTSIDDLVGAAESMSSWKDWYERHEAVLAEHFGNDADLFGQLLAATSQASNVYANVALALKAYRQYYANKPFDGYLPGVQKNLERIRLRQSVAGPKIVGYLKANEGDPDGIAVDRHIARVMFNTDKPNLTQIKAAKLRIILIADRLGWEPRQVQSALWTYNQIRSGKKEIATYDTLIQKRADEIASYVLLAENARRKAGGFRAFANAARQGSGQPGVSGRAGSGNAQEVEESVSASARFDPTEPSPLYASRPVVNAKDILVWARKQGFKTTLPAEDLHVTVAYSQEPMVGADMARTPKSVVAAGGEREVKPLGGEGAVVLAFSSPQMSERWQDYKDAGASWDYEGYQPHITLTYDGAGVDLASVRPYKGAIILGPEKQEGLDLDAGPKLADKEAEVSASPRTGQYKLGEFGYGRQFIQTVQDRYNRWKQAIEEIKAQGGTISEDNDFYLAEERYWGKVGAQIEDFKQEFEDWVKEVGEDGLDLSSVALYAYAQHAEDRNKWIANIRATMPDGGSGMTTADANQYLADAAASGLEPQLQKHSQKLRDWIQQTRDHMLAEGLITPDEYASWTHNMASYVPLRGMPEGMVDSVRKSGVGQGFNVRGAESKTAMGRRSEAKQIIENIVADRTRAYIRAGKNEVDRTFLKFVLDNPSPNLWEVSAVENKPTTTVDANGDRIIEERKKVISDDRTVTVKDGGKEISILVVDEKLREQLQNLHIDNTSTPIAALLFANRLLSRVYTSLNPVFALFTNPARDIQTAVFGAIDELGFIGAANLFKNMPAAVRESFAAEFDKGMSADYQLYRASGGKTGFFDFKTVDDLSKEMKKLADQAEQGNLDPRKVGRVALDLVESIGGALENATRLASFKTAREMGKTVAEAAHISKNLTVNFNRKGAMTPALSAMFLFFNPAVQGTTRMLQALKSPKVQATLGAAMTGIAMLALRNAAMGEDDDGIPWWDKIPDEVKERNFVFVLPPGIESGEAIPGSKTGRYVKFPMPYGYNFFSTVANQTIDVWRNSKDPRHGRGADKALVESFGAFMGSWVPMQELGTSVAQNRADMGLLGFVPDAFGPLAQNAMNVNPFGRPLSPEGDDFMPDSSKYFAGQAGTVFQKTAKALNSLTGGTDYKPGFIDITPGGVENLVRGYGGGPASFVTDILNAFYVRQSLERPELDVRRLPFAKQVLGVIDSETDRTEGYTNIKEAETIVGRVKAAKKDAIKLGGRSGDLAAAAQEEMEAEHPAISSLGRRIESTKKKLAKQRKADLDTLRDDGLTDAQKVIELMRSNVERREALQDFTIDYGKALLEERELKGSGR